MVQFHLQVYVKFLNLILNSRSFPIFAKNLIQIMEQCRLRNVWYGVQTIQTYLHAHREQLYSDSKECENGCVTVGKLYSTDVVALHQ